MSPRLEPRQRTLLTHLAREHRATPPELAPEFTLHRYDGGAALHYPTQTAPAEVIEVDLLILERANLILIRRPNNDVAFITILPEGLRYIEQEAYEQLKRRITALERTESKQDTLFRQRLGDLWTLITEQPPLQAIINQLQQNEPTARATATRLQQQHTPLTTHPERTRAAIATHIIDDYLNGPTSNESPSNQPVPLRIARHNTNSQNTESGISFFREELLHPLIAHMVDATGIEAEQPPPPQTTTAAIESIEAVRSRIIKAIHEIRSGFTNLTKAVTFAGEIEPHVYARQAVDALNELVQLRDANIHRLPKEAATHIDEFLRAVQRVQIDIGITNSQQYPPELRGKARGDAYQKINATQQTIDTIINLFRQAEEHNHQTPMKTLATTTRQSQLETWPAPPQETEHESFEVGNTIVGRFEIIKELGSGAFGIVYEAIDHTLEERVALKVLREANNDTIKRFKSEARLTRDIRHEGICRINDIHQTETGTHFLSMELIEGPTLKEQLTANSRSTPEDVVTLGKKLADALKAAHRQGVIHRDLKPANIMLARRGPVITDFGLARPVERSEGSLTTSGKVLGTLDYMAPEQARGEPPSKRVDVYAVGTILYETLTGTLPFQGSNANERIAKKLTQDPPRARLLNPEVSEELDRIILICLARDPNQRYEDANALLQDLESFRSNTNNNAGQAPPPELQLSPKARAGSAATPIAPMSTTKTEPTVIVGFHRIRFESNLHQYRLKVTLRTDVPMRDGRLELRWPAVIPIRQTTGRIQIARNRTEHQITLDIAGPIYPSEERELIGNDNENRIEYLVDDNTHQAINKDRPALAFRLYTEKGVLAEGTTPFQDLNEF